MPRIAGQIGPILMQNAIRRMDLLFTRDLKDQEKTDNNAKISSMSAFITGKVLPRRASGELTPEQAADEITKEATKIGMNVEEAHGINVNIAKSMKVFAEKNQMSIENVLAIMREGRAREKFAGEQEAAGRSATERGAFAGQREFAKAAVVPARQQLGSLLNIFRDAKARQQKKGAKTAKYLEWIVDDLSDTYEGFEGWFGRNIPKSVSEIADAFATQVQGTPGIGAFRESDIKEAIRLMITSPGKDSLEKAFETLAKDQPKGRGGTAAVSTDLLAAYDAIVRGLR